MVKMTHEPTLQISRSDLQAFDRLDEARITNVKHLSSYDWIEAPKPTIAVPGTPPLWSGLRYAQQLSKDSGLVYIAQNAARHPESPLEPLFRALNISQQAFDLQSVDLISDRNNLRKLLSFVDPTSERNGLEAFTITSESIANTVLFGRQETKVTEFIGANEFRGYGHAFEKAFTTNDSPNSTGHHRIVTYSFGNLRFVVRHETDACIASDATTQPVPKAQHDDFLQSFKALSLDAARNPSGSKLSIREKGRTMPIESTIEIKTRVHHRPIAFGEVAAQLWISQTPRLVRGYHIRGRFEAPKVENVAAEIQKWEDKSQSTLTKFAALIAKILAFVKLHHHAEIRYDPGLGRLIIRQKKGPQMLPQDLYLQWTAAEASDSRAVATSGSTRGPPSVGSGYDSPRCHADLALLQTDEISKNGDQQLERAIKVGGTTFMVPLGQVPYLAAFVKTAEQQGTPSSELEHGEIPLFEVALLGVVKGFRQCLYSLGTNIARHEELYNTYDLLEVDVLKGLSPEEVIENLKSWKGDCETERRGDKEFARDSAFQLLYLLLRNTEASHGLKDSDSFFDAVLFVVSHPSIFKPKMRAVIRTAYQMRFSLSAKQEADLHKGAFDGDAGEEDGTTTE